MLGHILDYTIPYHSILYYYMNKHIISYLTAVLGHAIVSYCNKYYSISHLLPAIVAFIVCVFCFLSVLFGFDSNQFEVGYYSILFILFNSPIPNDFTMIYNKTINTMIIQDKTNTALQIQGSNSITTVSDLDTDIERYRIK